MKKIHLLFFSLIAVILLAGASCVSLTGSSDNRTSGPAGMFLSTDKGESWKAISFLPTTEGVKNLSQVSVYNLVEDPQDPKAMYWASRANGLLYSYDNGQAWRQVAAPLNTGFIYSVAVHPNDRCTIFATNGRQVFKSDDCNRSWKEMYIEGNANRSIRSIAVRPFSPHYVYILENNGDMYRSEDGGVSWQRAYSFGENIGRMIFDPNNRDLIYVSTMKNGLYRSRDGGVIWESLSERMSGFSGALEYRRFFIYPGDPARIYWVAKYGILLSKNDGADWEPINLITPPGGAAIYSFAVNPKNEKEMYYTATINNRSTFYRTSDGGKNWVTRKIPSGQIPVVLRVHPEQPGWLFMGFTIPPKQ